MPVAGGREVWAWLVDDLLEDDDLLEIEGNPEGQRRWTDRRIATDVFSKSTSPRASSILIGVRKHEPHRIVNLGVVDAVGGVSTGKVRATVGSLLHLFGDALTKQCDIPALAATPITPRSSVTPMRIESLVGLRVRLRP
jgi:hypothetical protein